MRSQFLMAVVCGAIFAFGCSRPVSPPDESPKEKTGLSAKEAKDGQPAAKTPPGKEILAVSEAERKAILYFEKLSGKANISTLNSDRRVMKLDLNSTSAADADLKMLESLTALEELGACPNIRLYSRNGSRSCWALAFSASAQPSARTAPSICRDNVCATPNLQNIMRQTDQLPFG